MNAFSPDTGLSIVVRYHEQGDARLLDEAFFSLCLQDYDNLEVVVVAKNVTDEKAAFIERSFRGQPWRQSPAFVLKRVEFAPGFDGRSNLLNEGIRIARGRYLAFLDYDDLVYHHQYVHLVDRIQRSGRVAAIGQARMTKTLGGNQYWRTISKTPALKWGYSRLDLFRNNFIPIHSYVLDRERISKEDLVFDESYALLEDYKFLLGVFAKRSFDFDIEAPPVCEYRIRADGSNSVDEADKQNEQRNRAWEEARERIKAYKRTLTVEYNAVELDVDFHRSQKMARDQIHELQVELHAMRTSVLVVFAMRLVELTMRFPRLKRFFKRVVHAVIGPPAPAIERIEPDQPN